MQYPHCLGVWNDAHLIILHHISSLFRHISLSYYLITCPPQGGGVSCQAALSGIATDALSLLSLFYSGIDRSKVPNMVNATHRRDDDVRVDVGRGNVGHTALNGTENAKNSIPNSGIVEQECLFTNSNSNSNGKYIEQAVAMCRSAISNTS